MLSPTEASNTTSVLPDERRPLSKLDRQRLASILQGHICADCNQDAWAAVIRSVERKFQEENFWLPDDVARVCDSDNIQRLIEFKSLPNPHDGKAAYMTVLVATEDSTFKDKLAELFPDGVGVKLGKSKGTKPVAN